MCFLWNCLSKKNPLKVIPKKLWDILLLQYKYYKPLWKEKSLYLKLKKLLNFFNFKQGYYYIKENLVEAYWEFRYELGNILVMVGAGIAGLPFIHLLFFLLFELEFANYILDFTEWCASWFRTSVDTGGVVLPLTENIQDISPIMDDSVTKTIHSPENRVTIMGDEHCRRCLRPIKRCICVWNTFDLTIHKNILKSVFRGGS